MKEFGFPDGMYRVGPLARLNVASKISTPLANEALREWKSDRHGARRSSFYYHWARLIEIIYALERIQQLLDDPDICSTDIMVVATPTQAQGVGVVEAPRGTLLHHYWVDKNGRIEKANLIVATGNNNLGDPRRCYFSDAYLRVMVVPGPDHVRMSDDCFCGVGRRPTS